MNDTAATRAFGWSTATFRRGWSGIVRLVPCIRARYYYLEGISVLPKIGSSGRLQSTTPQRAFVIGDRRRIGTIRGRIEARVAFDVEIECGTQSGVVAELRASGHIVARQSMQPQVRIGR